VLFYYYEIVGVKFIVKWFKVLWFDKDIVKVVLWFVELYLCFYGYGSGEWIDLVVCCYVIDVGLLLLRLYKFTCLDFMICNVCKVVWLVCIYDELEVCIVVLV